MTRTLLSSLALAAVLATTANQPAVAAWDQLLKTDGIKGDAAGKSLKRQGDSSIYIRPSQPHSSTAPARKRSKPRATPK